jgi:uncharacterized phiE125 gp8 family phage protein
VKYRSLVRATPPAVEPVTLAEAKAHLRVDIATDDALITSIIKAAREWCEEYLDRSLVHTQWTMRMDSFPHEFVLPRPPMATSGTVTATTITYTLETQAVETLDTATYRVDRHDTPGRIRVVYAGTWPAHLFDENSVTVTWWGGYGADGTSVPAAIRSAMLMIISSLYEHRTAVLTGTISKEIEFGVKSMLDAHRWGSYR